MTSFLFPPPAPSVVAIAGGGLFPVRRIFCVGQNYAAHAREMGTDPTREKPVFFTKPADAVTQQTEIPFPSATGNLHFEGELVIALGKGGSAIPAEQALDCVFGYAAGCDLTRRDIQAAAKAAGGPWDMAKGFDLSAILSDIAPASAIGHPAQGRLTTMVNGQIRQDADLADMIWGCADIIAFLSGYVALAAGDLIYTGTPAGVGALVRGDKTEIAISGIGVCRFSVV